MKIKNHASLWLAVLAIAAISIPFLFHTSAQSSQAEDIPLIRLVADPERYQGKRVRVIGFVRLEFEGDVLYLHKEDYENGIIGNGVWINVPNTLNQQGRKMRSMKYCLIEGTFDAQNQGHMGMWSGAIKNISRFEVWSDPAKPRHSR